MEVKTEATRSPLKIKSSPIRSAACPERRLRVRTKSAAQGASPKRPAYYQGLPEEALVQCCQQQDLQAVEELIQRYERLVLNLVNRFLRHSSNVVDEAQEVFIKVLTKVGTFRQEARFSTWLYRLTVNHCMTVIKKHKQRVTWIEATAERNDQVPTAFNASPEKTYDDHAQKKQLWRAMDQLPGEQRQILIFYYYENLKYREIGQLLGLSEGTVCSRLYRARNNLRKQLQRLHVYPSH